MKIDKELLYRVVKAYGLSSYHIDDYIDSSHGEKDIRLHIIINDAYVLKINTADIITESFLEGINTLVEKYKSIGVWCPTIIKNKDDKLLTKINVDNQTYNCYLEEKSVYPFSKDDNMYNLKKKMLFHVGKLARSYSNQDLVNHYSMWSILDLGSMCKEIDEKQENLNDLLNTLRNKGYTSLANTLDNLNVLARKRIIEKYKNLPRCVFQGDLNTSNILVNDQNEFVGIIDFNMYGTEVNINCFINESMYYMCKEDFSLSTQDIINKEEEIQTQLLNCILKEYRLNDLETELFPYYKFITSISFYPNVQLWISLLEDNIHEVKIIEILQAYSKIMME